MTRKHFEAIARAISMIGDPYDRLAVAEELLEVLQETNLIFNADIFLKACGVRLG